MKTDLALTLPTNASANPAGPNPNPADGHTYLWDVERRVWHLGPMGAPKCCNRPPPGCGTCWYCRELIFGAEMFKINTLSTMIGRVFREQRRPRFYGPAIVPELLRVAQAETMAAGWAKWGGPR